jgi:N-acetylneuraminic acid mutarotase
VSAGQQIVVANSSGYFEGRNPMPVGRLWAGAAATGDAIYIVGGSGGQSFPDQYSNLVQRYDTVQNSWSQVGTAPYPSVGPGVGTVFTGQVFMCGGIAAPGDPPVNLAFTYYPDTGQWVQNPNMITGRANAACVSNYDNFYVIGGYDTNGLSGAFEVYNVNTHVWTQLPPAPYPFGMGSAVIISDKLYVFGGTTADISVRATLLCFNLTTGAWTEVTPPLYNIVGSAGAAYRTQLFSFGGLLVSNNVLGYSILSDVTGKVLSYDSTNNNWRDFVCNLARPRMGAVAVEYKGCFYVIGGSDRLGLPEASANNTPANNAVPWANNFVVKPGDGLDPGVCNNVDFFDMEAATYYLYKMI